MEDRGRYESGHKMKCAPLRVVSFCSDFTRLLSMIAILGPVVQKPVNANLGSKFIKIHQNS